MDVPPADPSPTHSSPPPPTVRKYRPWSRYEESHLLARHEKGDTWASIGEDLNRSVASVKSHYHTALARKKEQVITPEWSDERDEALIKELSMGLKFKDIAGRMMRVGGPVGGGGGDDDDKGKEGELRESHIVERYKVLQRDGKLSDEVVETVEAANSALEPRKRRAQDFTAEEDERILAAWIAGVNDSELNTVLKVFGKKDSAVVKRRRKLVNTGDGVGMTEWYREMVGEFDHVKKKEGREGVEKWARKYGIWEELKSVEEFVRRWGF